MAQGGRWKGNVKDQLAEPQQEVFSREFKDGPFRLRVGLAFRGTRLELFARTRTRKGRRWVDDGGIVFSPDLPPRVQAPLVAAFSLFTAKKAEVEGVLKTMRKSKRRRQGGVR